MSKAPSPLLGFNNNVRHKGRVFHVQTEDSGVRHPHVITHLFMDGGRILKTTKTSYVEHLGSENMGEVVRKMMKEQHKAMFVALREGQFDEQIARGTSGQMPAMSSGSLPAAPVVVPSSGSIAVAAPVSARPSVEAPAAPAPVASAAPAPSESKISAGSLMTHLSDLPPPVATARPSGQRLDSVYREVSDEPRMRSTFPAASSASSTPLPVQERPSLAPLEPRGSQRPPAAAKIGDSGRYAASRPSSPFASNRPSEGQSIFGEEMISEKSLDEVILSYLAEDLDSTPEK